jgi:MORN repeat
MKLHTVIAVAAFFFLTGQAMAQTGTPSPPDWITATNQPCKIWNPAPQPNESVTWSGPCKDGYASGQGVLRWTLNGKPDVEYEGQYENGKRHGHGVLKTPEGRRIEGDWVNDTLLTGNRNAI